MSKVNNGRNRFILYKKIEGARVGYRLFNIKEKRIGYVKQIEFDHMVAMAKGDTYLKEHYDYEENETRSNNLVEKELALWMDNNPNDTLVIIPYEDAQWEIDAWKNLERSKTR